MRRIKSLRIKILSLIALFCIVLLLASYIFSRRKVCDLSNASLDSMSPSTQFVQSWHVHEDELVINLDEYVLWEPGEQGGDTYSRVQRTLVVEADGKLIPVPALGIRTLAIIIGRFNEDRIPIGSHGGGLAAVIPIDFEPSSVTVSVQTVNGTCLVNTSSADEQP